MQLQTRADARDTDRFAINALGIPNSRLMRRAARALAESAMELLSASGGRVCVFCGGGNNGGDGLGAAAQLLRHGFDVRLFLVGGGERMSDAAHSCAARFFDYGGVIEPFSQAAARDALADCGLVIDAIFGVGLSREVSGEYKTAIELITASPARVLSADIPSGIDADTGAILGCAVRADVTLTFTAPKPGHFLSFGCEYSGDVRVRGIGIPSGALVFCEPGVFTVTHEDICLPKRKRHTHKGDYGKLVILAGSRGYSGAPVLAARAASAAGAGLVRRCVPVDIYGIAAAGCRGEIVHPLPCADGSLSPDAAAEALALTSSADALLIGPGMRVTETTRRLVLSALDSPG
ncbi:MAG: NAD(P)H-hydrate epimerase, partial [Oscillospiraceae bacterium]|nr:NAD(P)H-hydrate epimerase [Oscillospiraceae bacterium]